MQNGDAWNSSGISTVYSGYDGLERPSAYDAAAVAAYNNAASDNVLNYFDSSTLDPERLYTVNMYFRGSPYQEEAFNNGTKGRTGTHTGYLQNQDGQWYVVHNIHGRVHIDPFSSIQGGGKGWGVTGIYAPRKDNLFNRGITKLGFAEGGTVNKFDGNERSQLLRNEDLAGTGWYWAGPEQALSFDPLYATIVGPNNDYKDTSYLFNSEGMLVPKSVAEQYAANRKKFEDVLPDNAFRNGVYAYLNDLSSRYNESKSDNMPSAFGLEEQLKRFLDVYNMAGNPTVRKNPAGNFEFLPRNWKGSSTPEVAIGGLAKLWPGDILIGPTTTNNFDPIRIGHNITDEVPHSLQKTLHYGDYANWGFNWEDPHNEVIPGSGADYYDQNGSFEHQAHKIIKPLYMSYVTGIAPKYILQSDPGYRDALKDAWYLKNRQLFASPITDIDQMKSTIMNAIRSSSEFGANQYRSIRDQVTDKKRRQYLDDGVSFRLR